MKLVFPVFYNYTGAPIDGDGQRDLAVGSGRMGRALRIAASLSASAFIGYYASQPLDATVIQPDTFEASEVSVSGQASLAGYLRSLNGQQAFTQYLVFAPQDLTTLPVQPDTCQGPIAGTRDLSQSLAAGRWGNAAFTAVNFSPEDASGPLPTQPDTYQAAIGGTGNLARLQAAQGRMAVGSFSTLLQNAPFDPNSLQPDPYQGPVAGVASLCAVARAQQHNAVTAFSFFFTPEDLSGPLPTQPDTYQGPEPSIAGQLATAAYLRSLNGPRVVGRYYFFTTEDVDAPQLQPDSYQMPVAGVRELGQTLSQAGRSALVFYAVNFSPEDVSGPLPTQSDTWTQPVLGTNSLRSIQLSASSRATAAATYLFWNNAGDVPTIPVQPDTCTQQPASYQLLAGLIQFRSQAVRAFQTYLTNGPEDLTSLAAQPDTWTPPQVIGSRVWARTLASRQVVAASAWAAYDAQFIGDPLQPETWTQPVSGTTALAGTIARRAAAVRASMFLCVTPEDTSVASLQPDTYQAAVAGVRSIRLGLMASARAARGAWSILIFTPVQGLFPDFVPDLSRTVVVDADSRAIRLDTDGRVIIVTADPRVLEVDSERWSPQVHGHFFDPAFFSADFFDV